MKMCGTWNYVTFYKVGTGKNKITRKIRPFIKGEPESLHSKNNFEPMNCILSLKNVQF
jgi:hypothetical protein